MVIHMPFFSVITVVLNDEPGLRRTHRSLVEQTERDFEWIIVDGASRDGTIDFVRQLDLTFLRWVSEKDAGIYDAMNKGARLAQGGYLIYMNAGDRFSDGSSLADVRESIEFAGRPELCFAGCNYYFANGTLLYRPPRRMETTIWHGLPAVHQATLYRRDFLEECPYGLNYYASADYFIVARCFVRGGEACYVNRAVSVFYAGGISSRQANASLRECWHIQRNVLHQGWARCLLSATRRFVAHRVIRLLPLVNAVKHLFLG